MKRREFIYSAALLSGMLGSNIALRADELKKKNKSCILLWMNGGPSTIDIWDLKPDSPTGGKFKPIPTSADGIQICEHLPLLSKQMHNLSIIRSMSTREADHTRGRYYLHTGYVPSPVMEHPSYGSVVSNQINNPILEIPSFVCIGGASIGAGFLGASYSPFVIDTNGNIRNLNFSVEETRMFERLKALETIEKGFIKENRGQLSKDHSKTLGKTVKIMSSSQMDAFKINKEPEAIQQKYGDNSFGRSCLMARRLVELGVPFIEVDFGGWDNHADIFTTLEEKLPIMDQAMNALIQELNERGLYEDTAIVWMGEFGRTPNINTDAGRDHYAKAWSVVVGGAGFKGGQIIGATNDKGTDVITEPYSSEDLMASVINSLGISLETNFTSNDGRPMKIANSGKLITDLF